MKYLYLRYLNFRLWLIRRRLRRMNLHSGSAPYHMKSHSVTSVDEQRLALDWIKIGMIASAVLSMWVIFGLLCLEHLPIIAPPPSHSASPRAFPDPITPESQPWDGSHPKFKIV